MLKFLGKAIYIACWLLQHYLSKKCGVGLASTEIPDLKTVVSLCVNLINWERTRDFLSLFFSPECVGKWGENHKYSINSEFWHQEEGVKDVVEF